MSQVKVLLNETLYRTKEQFKNDIGDNNITRYRTWGYFEKTLRNGIEFLGPLIKIEDISEDICPASLSTTQIQAILENGFWQCLHDGKTCGEVGRSPD